MNLIINYLQSNPYLLLLTTAIFSLCIGSFLNVVIYRLPIMLQTSWRQECHSFLNLPFDKRDKFNLNFPRSHCPHCQKPLKIIHNIPIFSYLFLRGQCAFCKAAISWRYPLIELTTCLLSLIVMWHFGLNASMIFALVFTWFLICLFMIDFDHFLLPDPLTLSLLWLGLLANVFGLYTSLSNAVLGALLGYLSLWSFACAYKWLTGKQGMGHGDFKLFAALGAWVGWPLLLSIILCSSLVGSFFGSFFLLSSQKTRDTPIPFGPFLAISGWIALLWGQPLVNFYFNYAAH